MRARPAVLRGGAGLRTGDGADDPGRRTKAYPAALPPRLEMTHSPPGGLFHFGGQRNLSGMWRRRLTHTVRGGERVDQGLVRLTRENLTTGSQHSAVAAYKGGWVAIDLRSTVGLASLPRSGRGRPSPGMLAKACSIASAASRSSRSPRKRPVT